MKRIMFRQLGIAALFATALLLSSCAGNKRQYATSLQYIDAETVEAIKLPEVPAKGSALFESDFKTLHDEQESRTEGDCLAAEKDAKYDFPEMFPTMKEFYEKLPEANRKFIDSVGDETYLAVKIAKRKYDRARPYETDTTLEPCITKPKKGSRAYPSGHATYSRVYALMLTELMPKRRSEFVTRAEMIGRSRIVGGVHHPTDIEAGRRLGNALFAKYMENKLFRANMRDLHQYLPK